MAECAEEATAGVAQLVPPRDAGYTGCPNLLQLTACTFLVPAALCVAQGRLVGVVVHCSNAVCSTYAHRPDRAAKNTASDVLDRVLVGVWVAYNASLVYEQRADPDIAAIALAAAVVAARVTTMQFPYRSHPRYAAHAVMHLCGTVGSVLLLCT